MKDIAATARGATTRRTVLAGLASAACLRGTNATGAEAATAATTPALQPGVRTGGSQLIEVGKGLNVWTKHVGSASGPQVLTLHGGPGLPHFYFECFEDFLPQAGIGYWYYDQLGCGFSDQPTDTRLWTLERYTEEVERVRRALGQDRLILLGHSWGGMLAIEYALAYPQHVRGIVISNMTASIASYLAHLNQLRAALPQEQQQALAKLEAQGDFTSKAYEDLMWGVLYHRHICRLDPWPEPVLRAVKYLAEPVYRTIQGADEFHVTGNMKAWDRWQDLARITAPALVIGARHDTISADDITRMGRLLPHGRSVICPNGSHLAMYDDQAFYFSKLIPFLQSL
jgi:proline iminopeptidase